MSYPKQLGSGTESGYNGWKNYETWNVALWIQNDEKLYGLAKSLGYLGYRAFAKAMKAFEDKNDYTIHQIAFETPDNVSWDSPDLDVQALTKMMREL